MKLPSTGSDRYGIVIDSGSSGSRIQIYKWEEGEFGGSGEFGGQKGSQGSSPEGMAASPPKISQEQGWTFKIGPGVSEFGSEARVKEIWPEHYGKLVEFAEKIVPEDKHGETPLFVLATAGMRLLPTKEKEMILGEICSTLHKNSRFYVGDCQDYVQVIDGETEGIYGWLSLNYLMGQFDNYSDSTAEHPSIGFMDMGGASTQLAFVPSSKDEIDKHKEDLSRVVLRNLNGEAQEWFVFSQTWLGFGANEARRRYLKQLIHLSSIDSDPSTREINDPCLPKGAKVEYTIDGQSYNVLGLGNYEECSKTVYPLLMKNKPCKDDPCLFNGVHAPRMDFSKDKFVGISEYWYTANDVFQSGGEYNFLAFNEKVKEFCQSDWDTILQNAKDGKYSLLEPEKFLKDACFKANWVLNVLHEGFDLPRLGLDISNDISQGQQEEVEKIATSHVPFKSTDSVNGDELSWTLGKILLFSCSQIIVDNMDTSVQIGIHPSEISGKTFLPGADSLSDSSYDSDSDNELETKPGVILTVMFFLVVFVALYRSLHTKHFNGTINKIRRIESFSWSKVIQVAENCFGKLGLASIFSLGPYSRLRNLNDTNINLEEGMMSSSASTPRNIPNLSVLRTRSVMSLEEARKELQKYEEDLAHHLGNQSYTNFVNKPFFIPPRQPYKSLQRGKDTDTTRP